VEDFDPSEAGQNAPTGFADPSYTVPSTRFATGSP